MALAIAQYARRLVLNVQRAGDVEDFPPTQVKQMLGDHRAVERIVYPHARELIRVERAFDHHHRRRPLAPRGQLLRPLLRPLVGHARIEDDSVDAAAAQHVDEHALGFKVVAAVENVEPVTALGGRAEDSRNHLLEKQLGYVRQNQPNGGRFCAS